MKTRKDAIELLHSWVESESLRKHCYAVAAAMEFYARKEGLSAEEIEDWYIAGLLHDMDYEKFPSLEQHAIETAKILRKEEYSEEILAAILGHNEYHKLPRNSKMAKTLFAVDELCGLIVALAKVRPENFEGMNAESVKKAIKKKDFAAAINREDIARGISELGVSEDEHYNIVIGSLKDAKGNLGFS